jgi:Cd2+/Zn2+-exporting ATPase
MGAGGSAMAAEAADIVIMSDSLTRLPPVLAQCRLGRALVIQNCTFALTIKLVAAVLAILGETYSIVVLDVCMTMFMMMLLL